MITYKQIQLYKQYLIDNGIAESEVMAMTITEILDTYYKMRGVNL